jgi:hypothetical protein
LISLVPKHWRDRHVFLLNSNPGRYRLKISSSHYVQLEKKANMEWNRETEA